MSAEPLYAVVHNSQCKTSKLHIVHRISCIPIHLECITPKLAIALAPDCLGTTNIILLRSISLTYRVYILVANIIRHRHNMEKYDLGLHVFPNENRKHLPECKHCESVCPVSHLDYTRAELTHEVPMAQA